jgi:hypothetical protein
LANACTRDRSHLRSLIASVVQYPLRKLPFSVPRGAPGLSPPCKRHRRRPRRAGHWQAVPARVHAPHRGARLKFSSRFPTSWFMGLSAKIFIPLLFRAAAAASLRPLAYPSRPIRSAQECRDAEVILLPVVNRKTRAVFHQLIDSVSRNWTTLHRSPSRRRCRWARMR